MSDRIPAFQSNRLVSGRPLSFGVTRDDMGLDDATTHGQAPDSLDLGFLLRLLWRRRRLFFGTTLPLLFFALLVVAILPAQYTAFARIIIDPRPPRAIDIMSVTEALPDDRTTMLSEIELVHSSEAALRIIDEFGLAEMPAFNPTIRQDWYLSGWLEWLPDRAWALAFREVMRTGLEALTNHLNALSTEWLGRATDTDSELRAAQIQTRVIEAFAKHLQVVVVGESRVIEIAFSAPDPELAAAVANRLAEMQVVRQQELLNDLNMRTNAWLNTQLEQLNRRVADAERAVADYREREILTTTRDTQLLDQQVVDLTARLVDARTGYEERRARYDQAVQLADSPAALLNNLDAFNSQVLAQLRGDYADARRKEAELAGQLGDRHPQLVQLRLEIGSLRQQIEAAVASIVAGLRNELAAAGMRVAALETELADTQRDRIEGSRANIELDALVRVATAERDLQGAFLQRARETAQTVPLQSQARVVSTATIPAKPAKPRRLVLALAAGLASTLIGLGLTLLVENTRRAGYLSIDELEDVLDLPAHAAVPHVSSRELRHVRPRSLAAYVLACPASVSSEAVRAAAVGLNIAVRQSGLGNVVVYTSAMPNEGKSSLVAAIAAVLAASGRRVLVIDADFLCPRMHDYLGVEPGLGLVALLDSDRVVPRDLVQRSPLAKVDVITAGAGGVMRNTRMNASSVARVVENLESAYDYVLIDATPVLAVSDTRLLLEISRHVVFVVRWNRTSRKAVRHAVSLLQRSGAMISGIILNLVDRRRAASYDFTEAHYLTDPSYERYFEQRSRG